MPNAKAILNYNFKGGVGKTTLTGLEGYILSKYYHKKILLVDFDPQANLTFMMKQTYHREFKPTLSLVNGLMDQDLTSSVCKVSNNIDILPATWNLIGWPPTLEKIGRPNRYLVLDYLLKPFRNKYDYILLDVPPTLADYSVNAIFAADYVDIVLETQQSSYLSALKTVSTLQDFKNQYNAKFNFIGVILYLMIHAKVDRQTVRESINMFGPALFKHRILRQERVKGFSMNGIKNKDGWDKRALRMYKAITNEMLKRIKEVPNNEQ